jgi:hypothetical protein
MERFKVVDEQPGEADEECIEERDCFDQSGLLWRSRQRAQSIVEVVLAATALLVAGAGVMALYTGALQQAFQRLVTHINGI